MGATLVLGERFDGVAASLAEGEDRDGVEFLDAPRQRGEGDAPLDFQFAGRETVAVPLLTVQSTDSLPPGLRGLAGADGCVDLASQRAAAVSRAAG